MRKGLAIVFSVRAAVASDLPFVPRRERFADADVALDEILSLPQPAEPIVLRVTATGGSPTERASVVGDWFLDVRAQGPRRLPEARYSYDGLSARWSRGRSTLVAWEACPDARWMLMAVVPILPDRKPVVRSLVACARHAGEGSTGGDATVRARIQVVEGWLEGRVPRARVADVASVSYEDYYARGRRDEHLMAYSIAACATGVPSVAGNLATSAVSSVMRRWPPAERAVLRRELASIVRAEIRTLDVLRATLAAETR